MKDFETETLPETVKKVENRGGNRVYSDIPTHTHTRARTYGQRRVNKRVVRRSNVGAVSFNSRTVSRFPAALKSVELTKQPRGQVYWKDGES